MIPGLVEVYEAFGLEAKKVLLAADKCALAKFIVAVVVGK